MKKFLPFLAIALILGWVYFFVKEKKQWENPMTIANPASVFCEQNSWTLTIKDGTGWQYGICTFTNGSSCEERAYFRGECSPTDTTQPDTIPDTIQPDIIPETTIQPEDKPEQIDQPSENQAICTMEYAPVCAEVQVQCIKAPCPPIQQTFGNKCQMNANKLAKFLYEGECK